MYKLGGARCSIKATYPHKWSAALVQSLHQFIQQVHQEYTSTQICSMSFFIYWVQVSSSAAGGRLAVDFGSTEISNGNGHTSKVTIGGIWSLCTFARSIISLSVASKLRAESLSNFSVALTVVAGPENCWCSLYSSGRQLTLMVQDSQHVTRDEGSSRTCPNQPDRFLDFAGCFCEKSTTIWPTEASPLCAASEKSCFISWSIFWSMVESISSAPATMGYGMSKNSVVMGSTGPKSRWKNIVQSTPRNGG